jgi:hypothetical protein
MAVTRRAVTTGVPANTTSFVVTLPAHVTGSRILIAVAGKMSTASTPTITGDWTMVGRNTGGTGSLANDTGTEVICIFAKDAASASESNPTISNGGTAYNSWEWIAASYDPEAGMAWLDSIAASAAWVKSASDTTTGSPLTGTCGSWTAGQPTTGDAIFAVGGIPTDLGTALGATTLTATGLSGGTKSTATTQYVENGLGNDTAAVWADWTGFTGTASAGLAASFTVTSATNQSGVIVAVALRQGTPIPAAVTQSFYRIYADGTENTATALAELVTAPTVNLHGGDVPVGVRIMLQETAGGTVDGGGTIWRLQYQRNGGGWSNLAIDTVLPYASANLTDGGATTQRLAGGTGSYVAGFVCEDATIDDGMGITPNNYTEALYSVVLKAADLADGDTVEFRMLKNGATTDMTYSVTPTINIVKVAPVIWVESSASNVWDGASTGVVTKPTGTVDGNLLIACLTSDGSIVGVPSGFTPLTTSDYSGTINIRWGYRVASSEGASYTFTGNGDCNGFVLRVVGHDPTVTITQVAGVAVASGGGNAGAPGLTPAGSDDLLICVASHDGDAVAEPTDDLNWTPPSTMTEHEDRHSGGWTCSSIASEQLASGAATGTRIFDPASTNHRAGGAATIAIKAGAAGPPTVDAAAALTAISTLTATAFEENFATAALTATSTLTTAGVVTEFATAALSATSTLTATAVRTQLTTVGLSAASTLTAGAVRQPQGVAGLTAVATLTAASVREPQAAASLVATSTLTSTAVVTEFASVALTATASLTTTASIVTIQQAAVALTGASTLTITAVREPQAAASLIATSTLTTAATRVPQGSAALVATSSLTANANRVAVLAATLSATATLTATGIQTGLQPGSAALVGASTLTPAAVRTTFATTALVGASTLSGAGVVTEFASVSLSAASTLTTAGVRVPQAEASLVAAGTLTPTATQTRQVTAALTGTATLTTGAVITKVAGTALTAVAILTTGAVRQPQAAASLTATGTLNATAVRTATVSATLSATATLTATAIGVGVQLGTAALSASSTLSAIALRTAPVAAALVAGSTLTVTGVRTPQAAASLTSTATLTVAGARTAVTTVALTSSATLIATATTIGLVQGAVALTATGTLTIGTVRTQLGAATLTGVATLTTTAERIRPSTAELSATSTLTTVAIRQPQAAASLTATSTLTVVSVNELQAMATLSAEATLSVLAVRFPAAGVIQNAARTGTLYGLDPTSGWHSVQAIP